MRLVSVVHFFSLKWDRPCEVFLWVGLEEGDERRLGVVSMCVCDVLRFFFTTSFFFFASLLQLPTYKRGVTQAK